MKLRATERPHHVRAGEAVRGMMEPERAVSEVETWIRPQDKRKVITDLIKSKPKKWDDPLVSSWLTYFEECVVVFPDSKPQLDNAPSAWNAILEDWKEILPGWLVRNQILPYLAVLQFIYSNFPERRVEFPVDPKVVRGLENRIMDIRSRNPIEIESILSILSDLQHILPDAFAKLTEENKSSFTIGIPQSREFRHADVLGDYLVKIKLLYPEIFETLPVDRVLIEKMKRDLKPLDPRMESDIFLSLAYALRILTADEVRVDENGKLEVVDPGQPLAVAQKLPSRLVT